VWCSVHQAAYLQGFVRDVCRTMECVTVGCYMAATALLLYGSPSRGDCGTSPGRTWVD
jgi:hypothetical protein